MRKLTFIIAFILIAGCSNPPATYVDPDAPSIVNAAQSGNLATVKKILSQSPDAIWDTDSKDNSVASCAILNDHHDIAIFLIQSGFPINPKDNSDFPLIMSCLSRYTEGSRNMLEYLLENGADPNVVYESEGWVPLNMAANNGQEENVRLLVKHGARLDSKDRLGQTSLEMAKERVAQFKDPNFNYPHGELSDPKVRQDAIERWEKMVKLLTELAEGR